jgi:integral membrane protein (TIGR01906 family)
MKFKAIGLPGWLALVILAASIPVLIVSCTVNVYARSAGLYQYGFAKYRISQNTGISNAQLGEVAQGMADFLDGKKPSLQMTVRVNGTDRLLYNQKELVHMDDVRSIISTFKILQTVSILSLLAAGAFVFAALGVRRLLRGILAGAIATVCLVGLLAAWALVDFYSLFYVFHLVSFSNDLWLLDPTRDYLIMMFTESFFYDAAIMVTATIMAVAVIVGLVTLVIEKAVLNKTK